jgi:hypothetical protein
MMRSCPARSAIPGSFAVFNDRRSDDLRAHLWPQCSLARIVPFGNLALLRGAMTAPSVIYAAGLRDGENGLLRRELLPTSAGWEILVI